VVTNFVYTDHKHIQTKTKSCRLSSGRGNFSYINYNVAVRNYTLQKYTETS